MPEENIAKTTPDENQEKQKPSQNIPPKVGEFDIPTQEEQKSPKVAEAEFKKAPSSPKIPVPGLIYPQESADLSKQKQADKDEHDLMPKIEKQGSGRYPGAETSKVEAGRMPGLRTFRGDVQERLKSGKESLVSLASRAMERKSMASSAEASKTSFFDRLKSFDFGLILKIIAIVLVLTVLGVGIWYGLVYLRSPDTAFIPRPPKSFLGAPERAVITLPKADRSAFFGEWNKQMAEQLNVLQFKDVAIYNEAGQNYISSKGFFDLTEVETPQGLKSALLEKWTLGIIATPRFDNEPFFIFAVNSFEGSLAAMLSWEKFLPRQMIALAPEDRSFDRGTEVFKDEVILNNDVRVLKNPAGEPIFAYTIFNSQFLVMAFSDQAVEFVLDKFLTSPPDILIN